LFLLFIYPVHTVTFGLGLLWQKTDIWRDNHCVFLQAGNFFIPWLNEKKRK
jgi:phytoene/squalene synthetase